MLSDVSVIRLRLITSEPPAATAPALLTRAPLFISDVLMAKSKTTVYLDSEVLRTAKVWAARTGRRDSEVLEEALRSYLGLDALQNIWEKASLSETEALDIAYEELHDSRTP